MTTLEAAEDAGQRFAEEAGRSTLADLRAIPAEELSGGSGGVVIDGWIVPEDLTVTFAEGRQNAVDVLVGSNEDEGTFFNRGGTTAEQFMNGAAEIWRPRRRLSGALPLRQRRGSSRVPASNLERPGGHGRCACGPMRSCRHRTFGIPVLLHPRTSRRPKTGLLGARHTPPNSITCSIRSGPPKEIGKTLTGVWPTKCPRTGSTLPGQAIPTETVCPNGRNTRATTTPKS